MSIDPAAPPSVPPGPATTSPAPAAPPGAGAFDPVRDPYCIVIGHGRSGSNLALDLFDQHPQTFCRNEPNELQGGAMAGLTGGFEMGPEEAWPLTDWHGALRRVAGSQGVRDRRSRGYKSYYRSAADRILCEDILLRGGVRKTLTRLRPGRRREWDIASHLATSPVPPMIPVAKILLRPEWILRTHGTDGGQQVVHVMRDPVGFVASWLNRYVARAAGGPEAVHVENSASLDVLLDRLGGQLTHGRDFSTEALIESELWRWRYMNEIPYRALADSPRYRVWTYRALKERPVELAEATFPALGLPLDAATRDRIGGMRNTLFGQAHTQSIDREMIGRIAEEVLEGSPLRAVLEPTPSAVEGGVG